MNPVKKHDETSISRYTTNRDYYLQKGLKVMGMPLELNTMIVTKNKEEKTTVENVYTLRKDGYRLYPIDLPIVEVRTTKSASPYALAKINKLSWENGQTQLTYELVDLMGVN